MLTSGNGVKPQQTIVSSKLNKAYETAIQKVEASHGEASEALSWYWWTLYEIKVGNLWRAKFKEGEFKMWLGELCSETFGPKKSTYYKVMGAIDRFRRIGKSDDEIFGLLGNLSTALLDDFTLLFEKHGKGDLLPEIAAQIEAGGETPEEFLDRISDLSPSDQRQEVLRLVKPDSIYFMDDSTSYDELNGRLLTNVQWETKEDGIVYRGTVSITSTEITEPRKHSKKKEYLPKEVAEFIMSKLGIRE